jgi:hypothetical protein
MKILEGRYLFEKIYCPSCGVLFNAEMIEEKHECARISSDGSTGESPVWRKASHRSSTESCM